MGVPPLLCPGWFRRVSSSVAAMFRLNLQYNFYYDVCLGFFIQLLFKGRTGGIGENRGSIRLPPGELSEMLPP